MQYIEQVLNNPVGAIMTVLVVILAVKEVSSLVEWIMGKNKKMWKSASQQEDFQKRVCDIACISEKHTETLGGIESALEGLKADIKDVRSELGRLDAKMDESEAIGARVRILRMNDEILRKTRHTKESFDQTLDDITKYDHYCKEHPDFENDKTVMATGNIRDTYKKCMEERDFL